MAKSENTESGSVDNGCNAVTTSAALLLSADNLAAQGTSSDWPEVDGADDVGGSDDGAADDEDSEPSLADEVHPAVAITPVIATAMTARRRKWW